MKHKKYLHKVLLCTFLLCAVTQAQAQLTFPGGDNTDDETPAAPIDGFVSIALIAGAVYGLRKKLKSDI